MALYNVNKLHPLVSVHTYVYEKGMVPSHADAGDPEAEELHTGSRGKTLLGPSPIAPPPAGIIGHWPAGGAFRGENMQFHGRVRGSNWVYNKWVG